MSIKKTKFSKYENNSNEVKVANFGSNSRIPIIFENNIIRVKDAKVLGYTFCK
jgi:hypothetical protein